MEGGRGFEGGFGEGGGGHLTGNGYIFGNGPKCFCELLSKVGTPNEKESDACHKE